MNSFVSACDIKREKNLATESRHHLKGTFRGKLLSLQETLVSGLGSDLGPDLLGPTPGLPSSEAMTAYNCCFFRAASVSLSG